MNKAGIFLLMFFFNNSIKPIGRLEVQKKLSQIVNVCAQIEPELKKIILFEEANARIIVAGPLALVIRASYLRRQAWYKSVLSVVERAQKIINPLEKYLSGQDFSFEIVKLALKEFNIFLDLFTNPGPDGQMILNRWEALPGKEVLVAIRDYLNSEFLSYQKIGFDDPSL